MQQALMPFYESAEEATNSAILRSGNTFQEVAHKLRPELKIDSAYAWLKNALKDGQREKLSSDQHVLIANLCGEYEWLHYSNSQCHHKRTEPLEPDDEAIELDREINTTLKSVEQLLKRRERINLKAVAST